MKVSDVMAPDVEVVNPDDTLKTAAQLMADLDSGALTVGENDLLIGVITDHDITVRAVAKGRDPEKTQLGRDRRGIFVDHLIGTAVLEYGPTEILPPVGAQWKAWRVSADPVAKPAAQTHAESGVLDLRKRLRERD